MMHVSSSHRRTYDGDTQDELSAIPFLLDGDYQKAELRILPMTKISVVRNEEDIRHFQVEISSRIQDDPNMGPTGAGRSSVLLLSIHSQFLEKPGRRPSSREDAEIVTISDGVAGELAYGLLSSEWTNELSPRARYCAVVMLCDRIAGLLNRSERTLPNRFHEWQISALDEALSGKTDEVASIESVAARCGLSTCHFSRLFKAEYGAPFHKFLVQARIKRAQCQLVDSEDPISQIALDCGFADQSCFTRRFTIAIGVSPASWRKQAKRAKASDVMPSVPVRTYARERSVA